MAQGSFWQGARRIPQRTGTAGRKRRAVNRGVEQGGLGTLPIGFKLNQFGSSNGTPTNRDTGVTTNTTVPILEWGGYDDTKSIGFLGRHDGDGYIELAEESSEDAFWRADKAGSSAPFFISQGFSSNTTQTPTCRWSPFTGNANTTFTLTNSATVADNGGAIQIDVSQARDGWWFGIIDTAGNLSAGSVQISVDPNNGTTGWNIEGSTTSAVYLNTAYQAVRFMLTNGNTRWIRF